MSRSWLAIKDAKDSLFGRLGRKLFNTELENLGSDMLHALLLLLQRRDPSLQRRVVKYLRCESLNAHDRKLLGALLSRDQPEDPLRTFKHVAHIQFELQTAALVIVIGQIEETIPDGQTVTRLQQDFDSLRTIAVVASSSGAGRGTAIGAARADRDRDLHAGQQCGASAAAAIDPVAARSQDFS